MKSFRCPTCGKNRFFVSIDEERTTRALEDVANGDDPLRAALARPEGLLVHCATPTCTYVAAARDVETALKP
jgi:hypothetical protein